MFAVVRQQLRPAQELPLPHKTNNRCAKVAFSGAPVLSWTADYARKDRNVLRKYVGWLEAVDRRIDWERVEKVLLPFWIVGIAVGLVVFASLFVERTAMILWVMSLLGFVK